MPTPLWTGRVALNGAAALSQAMFPFCLKGDDQFHLPTPHEATVDTHDLRVVWKTSVNNVKCHLNGGLAEEDQDIRGKPPA